jgi:hypothetical protein
MTKMRVAAIVVLTALLCACTAKAQVRTEPPLPPLDPPAPPPRVVAAYEPEPEPIAITPAAEPTTPVRPPARQRPEQKPEPPITLEPVENARPAPGPSLTLTPTPGSEAQTVTAIRDLLRRATNDLARVNVAALNTDGKSQYETARRFIQQADDALKARNIVFAGKLADKAATMAAVLVR